MAVAGCTTSTGTPGPAPAADSPKQVLPPAPSLGEPALPTPEPKSTEVPQRSEEGYLGLRLLDVDHELDGRSDAELVAVGDAWCTRVTAGTPVADAARWVVEQGYRDVQASRIVIAAGLSLCPALNDEVVAWAGSGHPGLGR
ncbi:DUF732 domain-containing protein [Streptomyces sp. TLI_171]|uniref:DUF732 domain-containing protein n=1 Tax=Streptomyces sp. TLI_171 TaxID=1938859 RepID=UPI000C1743D2|nr:DUF732 domain-containing protein [Streptomyces sp. TLI_171]